jgi:hypothetical protein
MKRTIAPAALVIVFATVFVLGIPPKLRVDDRRQLVEGELVSGAPGTAEFADIVGRLGCRFRGPLDDCWTVLRRPDRSTHNSSSRC